MNIREFIPPILFKIKSSTKNYKTYLNALEDLKNETYDNSELCNLIAEKTVNFKSTELSKEIDNSNFFLLSVINSYISQTQKNHLTIVDFGGACGAHYFTITKLVNDKKIKFNWIVVETKEMVNAAINANLQNDQLTFTDSLENLDVVPDIVHSSCALHYVDKPFQVLQQLINLNAKVLAFNKMLFEENNLEGVFIQKSRLSNNGIGKLPSNIDDKIIKYPCSIFSFSNFNEFIQKKYHLTLKFDQTNHNFFLGGMNIKIKALLFQLK